MPATSGKLEIDQGGNFHANFVINELKVHANGKFSKISVPPLSVTSALLIYPALNDLTGDRDFGGYVKDTTLSLTSTSGVSIVAQLKDKALEALPLSGKIVWTHA
ncbi:hypothetical protein CVT26_011115 [Gymnopilus dilepis]|uniref:Uncharacterized protein n=1 Tax=Gymnopilus dilepis TaxID=231916 RepID=A0A409VYT3_9AGAR|nr:hypothetical protein CVT26_011115 [Gymnopilus dilepis]